MRIYLQHLSSVKDADKVKKIKKESNMAKILVANGEKVFLKKYFNTTYPTVRDALNGKTNSSLAKKIRYVAIKRGGMEQIINTN